MDRKEIEFRKRLLSTFKVESVDHLKTISSGIIELEKLPPAEVQAELVENIFRSIHSLKGAARAVNLPEIETVCQAVEGVFAAWKRRGVSQGQDAFETLYLAVDIIKALISSLGSEGPSPEKGRISRVVQELSRFEKGAKSHAKTEDKEASTRVEAGVKTPEAKAPEAVGTPLARPYEATVPVQPLREHAPKESPFLSGTVRISTAKLGSLLLQTEEMLNSKLAARQQLKSLKETSDMLALLKNEFTRAYVDVLASGRLEADAEAALDFSRSARLHDFFNWAQTHIKAIEGRIAQLTKSSGQYTRSLDRMVDGLLEDMKKAAMLPFSTLLESFPMLVRDLSHEQGKVADLVIRGENIEIDRRILEEMKDPLIHLIRNCVDHGIERPELRSRSKKPQRGTIAVSISAADAGKAELLISDDGAGIDVAKVKKAAVENGIISQAESEAMDHEDAMLLIFRSGVSTSPIITDLSGRGLGLAIVREKVEKLGGAISASSSPAGTTFRIILPLTMATFRGILVKVSGRVFVIPTSNVERTVRVKTDGIKTVENRETVLFNGHPVSFARLSSVLELPAIKKPEAETGFTQVVVLSFAEKRIAFGVDEVVGEQEVLVKGLGRQLSRVRNISGAALLGSGRPVPVLNVSDLLVSAVRASVAPSAAPVVELKSEAASKTVLVVEDSITSRILLRTILESAGYNVKTAFDGIDAITLLKTEEFDLVVSDIEMPRMNGFDLTSRIRGDKKLSELPVVLVTALESREDRERGIEVGANAYIVKSSFDQSNLLEVIQRLI